MVVYESERLPLHGTSPVVKFEVLRAQRAVQPPAPSVKLKRVFTIAKEVSIVTSAVHKFKKGCVVKISGIPGLEGNTVVQSAKSPTLFRVALPAGVKECSWAVDGKADQNSGPQPQAEEVTCRKIPPVMLHHIRLLAGRADQGEYWRSMRQDDVAELPQALDDVCDQGPPRALYTGVGGPPCPDGHRPRHAGRGASVDAQHSGEVSSGITLPETERSMSWESVRQEGGGMAAQPQGPLPTMAATGNSQLGTPVTCSSASWSMVSGQDSSPAPASDSETPPATPLTSIDGTRGFQGHNYHPTVQQHSSTGPQSGSHWTVSRGHQPIGYEANAGMPELAIKVPVRRPPMDPSDGRSAGLSPPAAYSGSGDQWPHPAGQDMTGSEQAQHGMRPAMAGSHMHGEDVSESEQSQYDARSQMSHHDGRSSCPSSAPGNPSSGYQGRHFGDGTEQSQFRPRQVERSLVELHGEPGARMPPPAAHWGPGDQCLHPGQQYVSDAEQSQYQGQQVGRGNFAVHAYDSSSPDLQQPWQQPPSHPRVPVSPAVTPSNTPTPTSSFGEQFNSCAATAGAAIPFMQKLRMAQEFSKPVEDAAKQACSQVFDDNSPLQAQICLQINAVVLECIVLEGDAGVLSAHELRHAAHKTVQYVEPEEDRCALLARLSEALFCVARSYRVPLATEKLEIVETMEEGPRMLSQEEFLAMPKDQAAEYVASEVDDPARHQLLVNLAERSMGRQRFYRTLLNVLGVTKMWEVLEDVRQACDANDSDACAPQSSLVAIPPVPPPAVAPSVLAETQDNEFSGPTPGQGQRPMFQSGLATGNVSGRTIGRGPAVQSARQPECCSERRDSIVGTCHVQPFSQATAGNIGLGRCTLDSDPVQTSVPAARKVKGLEPLRAYQRQCIELINQGDHNYIVIAPTGSGKTRICIEAAKYRYGQEPSARIVFIVPKVALTKQQADEFVTYGFKRELVSHFSSENKKFTREALKKYVVIVMTAQLLVNSLDDNLISMDDIRMLILDECHWARGDHPYNKLATFCRDARDEEREEDDPLPSRATRVIKTQIIGCTASPTVGSDTAAASSNLCRLLEALDVKTGLWIPDDNVEIAQLVPKAQEVYTAVKRRDADGKWGKYLGELMQDLLRKAHEGRAIYNTPLGDLDIESILRSSKLTSGFASSTLADKLALVQQRIDKSAVLEMQKADFKEWLGLLERMNSALDLVHDVGRESTYDYVNDYISKRQESLKQQFPNLFDGQRICNFKNLARCFQNHPPIMMTRQGQAPLAIEARSFPRFAALVDIIHEHSKGVKDFHGIVFVRTRAGVAQLCEMLKSMPQLEALDILMLVGHGKGKKMQIGMEEGNKILRGMTSTAQDDVLKRFRATGECLLLATSAAEEGIDVASCELVVRYTVSQTGTERVQSRGRARKQGARFYNIVEEGSPEHIQYKRSRKEEGLMNEVLKAQENIHRIDGPASLADCRVGGVAY
ncbi:unnamed protein product [Ostreobium quekettii]|uniref:Uncharacterized protein n=1 Tax=Ostreobium quekettii TaxID=121088 RepID=A0A8S1ISW4_9CHLO|nr:unnamed protein product [Ostreobium quekettii]